MQFLPTLKVKLVGCDAELGECAFQVRHRRLELRSRPDTGTAAYDKVDAEKVLERLDPLSNSGGGQTEQFPGALERSRPNREFERLK